MDAKNHILTTLARSRIPDPGLPDLSGFFKAKSDPVGLPEFFSQNLRLSGGDMLSGMEIDKWLKEKDPRGEATSSLLGTTADFEKVPEISKNDAAFWASRKVLKLEAKLGVAENGAVWVNAGSLPHRAAFILPEHLLVYLKKESLVPTMHEAYACVGKEEWDYGVFVSGPSKTADIEQSLVIGAQGARSLRVVLI